jgi:hypothetical protein
LVQEGEMEASCLPEGKKSVFVDYSKPSDNMIRQMCVHRNTEEKWSRPCTDHKNRKHTRHMNK